MIGAKIKRVQPAKEDPLTDHLDDSYGDGADPYGDGADNRAGSSQPGPLSDEALRLVSAVQDWARRSFPQADDEHVAGDCQWCPLCQFVAVLRGERPEVTERVAEAGTAVMSALRALVDAASSAGAGGSTGQHRRPGPAPAPRVQRINLSDES